MVGQRIAVDPDATGRENLELQGLLYRVGGHELRQRIDALLESFGLIEVAGRMARTYSGGMQRKLDVAMGLVHRPRVLFLDEPTTGLDPEARAELWAEIARLAAADGLTILLTTHYLEEADRLASRVAIVDRGRIVASGTPDDLKAELRGDAVLVELQDAGATGAAAAALAGVGGSGGAEDRRSLAAGARAARGVGSASRRLGPGARRRGGRIRDRRAALARRRVPAPYRPGVPATAGGLHRMTAIAQTMYMTRRHTRTLLRQPWFVAITLVQPIIWLLLFGTLFRSVTEIPGFTTTASYLDYLVPGVVVMTALFSSGWSGMGLIDDMERGLMDRFLVAPLHRSSVIVGRLAYEALNLVVQASIIGVLAWLLGARFESGIGGFAILVVGAALLAAAFGSLSNALALLLRQRESVIGANTFLVLPITFLSAAFMPLALAPEWIASVARFNPVNWAVEAGREALTASPDPALIVPRLAGLFVLAVISAALATRAFRAYQRSI